MGGLPLHGGKDCALPMMQFDSADALGLSAAHVKRIIRRIIAGARRDDVCDGVKRNFRNGSLQKRNGGGAAPVRSSRHPGRRGAPIRDDGLNERRRRRPRSVFAATRYGNFS